MFYYFKQCVKKFKIYFITFLFFMILDNICSIVYPLVLNETISNLANMQNRNWILFIFLSLLSPIAAMASDYILSYVILKFQSNTTVELMSIILNKDKKEIQKYNSNEIVRKCSTYSWMLNDFFLTSVLCNFIDFIKIFIIIFILMKKNVYITLFIVISCLIRLFIINYYSKKIRLTYSPRFESYSRFRSCLSAYIIKIKSIITRAKKEDTRDILSELSGSAKKNNVLFSKIQAFINMIDISGSWIIQVLTILFSSVLANYMAIGFDIVFLSYSYTKDICSSFANISGLMQSYQSLKAQSQLVQEYLDIENLPDTGIEQPFNEIELKDVSFSYNDKQKVLNKLNYVFKKGDINLIIGENGTGKSTLISLLSGQYTPDEGKILMNHINLNEYNIKKYQSDLVCVLTQSDRLFSGTVLENLLYDNAKKYMDHFGIVDLQKEINFTNDNISGGEKRKILLARLFAEIEIKNPSLVILDEPLYALDPKTAEFVRLKIEELSQSKIVIVISHEHNIQRENALRLVSN